MYSMIYEHIPSSDPQRKLRLTTKSASELEREADMTTPTALELAILALAGVLDNDEPIKYVEPKDIANDAAH